MNILLFGDIHIRERDIPEIEEIFSELLIIKDKYNVSKLYITGDTFDTIHPSPKELDCFSHFVKKLNIPIILLAANSHESISTTESIINHLGILNDKILVAKEYNDEDYLFVGHFTLKESSINYGATRSKSELNKYKYVVLGHQHSFQIIPDNICHLGSIRYIDFTEAQDKKKICLLITDYKENNEKCHFLGINSCYPMVDLILKEKASPERSDSQIALNLKELVYKLDNLDPKTKVRLIFEDFGGYKQFLPIYAKYKDKFVLFKDKKEFNIVKDAKKNKEELMDVKKSLISYLDKNKIDPEIRTILTNIIQ